MRVTILFTLLLFYLWGISSSSVDVYAGEFCSVIGEFCSVIGESGLEPGELGSVVGRSDSESELDLGDLSI